MTFDFWKKTGQMKPFDTVEQFDKFASDLISESGFRGIQKPAAMNRAIAKKGIANGVNYDSFAEFTFYTYMTRIEHASVERNERSSFLYYTDENNKQRKYYPDFIVNGCYTEVKGIVREKDEIKRRQHPEVKWYYSEDIKKMAEVLDSKIKGWRDEFSQTNITRS